MPFVSITFFGRAIASVGSDAKEIRLTFYARVPGVFDKFPITVNLTTETSVLEITNIERDGRERHLRDGGLFLLSTVPGHGSVTDNSLPDASKC